MASSVSPTESQTAEDNANLAAKGSTLNASQPVEESVSQAARSTDDMRTKLMDATFELIQTRGLTHTSVDRIAKACGIGKGTFYHYFDSKEALVYELIERQGEASRAEFEALFEGRERLSMQAGKAYTRHIVERRDTIYRFLTPHELQKLEEAMPEKADQIRPGNRIDVLTTFLSRIENVRPDVDIEVVSALMKVMSVAFAHWDEDMVTPEQEVIYATMYEHLFSLIFDENLPNER